LFFEKTVNPDKETGMEYNTTIFNRLLSILQEYLFEQSGAREQGQRHTKHFMTWNNLTEGNEGVLISLSQKGLQVRARKNFNA